MKMKKYRCIVCDWVYDEYLGAPKEGIESGTKWEDVSEDWVCPDCGASKAEFEMVEI
ncbi:MAG: Rubredoxin [Candidatus Ruthia sp. Apha_13_S6]|nr:Rubredoxin [Candidatus Ruthia sp. Apha_13_S6]